MIVFGLLEEIIMADLNKPQVTPKSSTSRVDLGKAPVVAPAPGIRVGMNAKTSTTRIDISAIPAIAKAQTSRVGLGASVQPQPVDDDIYKRRTALLDTSKIPLKTTASAGAAGGSPRTIRIGNRPTVRLTPSSPGPATFSPGRTESAAPVAAPTAAPRPGGTIKLKRPGSGASGSSVTISGGSATSSPLTSFGPEPSFVTTPEEPETGAVWAVFSLLSLLAVIGLVVVQIMTNSATAY